MCSIIILKAGQMIDKEKLFNAVYNNWHSYGLVTKVDKKLDIKRVVPTSGEVDPEEVYKALLKDQEYDRFLHLRHNTAGATTIENTHPIDIFYDEKTGNHVVFMHNGTMYEYKSKKLDEKGSTVDDDDGPSDTRNFADRILIPYTEATDFGKGKGRIDSYQYQKMIDKFWPTTGTNRGLLISSLADNPFFLGSWTKIKDTKGNDIEVANADYFDKVTRGPEFTRRRLREEEEKKINQVTANSNLPAVITGYRNNVAFLKDYRLDEKHDFFALRDNISNIFSDFDLYERDGLVTLGAATFDELAELYKHEKECIAIMDYVFTDFAKLSMEYDKINEKHEKATKTIASMAKEIAALKVQLGNQAEVLKQKRVG